MNYQESTSVLNACTKSLETYWKHHVYLGMGKTGNKSDSMEMYRNVKNRRASEVDFIYWIICWHWMFFSPSSG